MNKIEQPWGDDRIKLNGVFIGCVTKANADYLIGLECFASKVGALTTNEVGSSLSVFHQLVTAWLGEVAPQVQEAFLAKFSESSVASQIFDARFAAAVPIDEAIRLCSAQAASESA